MVLGKQQRFAGLAGAVTALAEPAILAVLVLYLLYQFLLSHVEGDQAYLLYAAQQVLHGVALDGPRLIETNPPLIVWFSTVPAALAQWLHTDAVLCLRLVVLSMLCGSAAWGRRLLRLAAVDSVLSGGLVRILWAATFLLITVVQPAEFGQREQLLLALFLPYLLAVGSGVVRLLGPAERTGLGLCAGLAVCFKPQHVLTLVCLELFLAVRAKTLRRLVSPEVLAAVAIGLFYVAAVRVATPAYLFTVMPLLQSTYWALGQYTYAAMIFRVGGWLTLSVLCGIAAWFLVRARLVLPQLVGAMLASAVGAWLAYVVQHTGWYHQRFPAVTLLLIAALWMGADALRVPLSQPPQWNGARRFAWVALPLCSALLFGAVLVHKRHAAPGPDDMVSELAQVPPGTTVYAFSVGMDAFPVVLEHHLQWGSRFAHLWMLPAIRAYETSSSVATGRRLEATRAQELATLQRRETVEDLRRTRPTVIFVEQCRAVSPCQGYREPFDAVQWFSQDSEFADLWRSYRLQRVVQGFDVYTRNAGK